jgi:hypothetical protein
MTTEELMALQTVGDPCSCTQIYRFYPLASIGHPLILDGGKDI